MNGDYGIKARNLLRVCGEASRMEIKPAYPCTISLLDCAILAIRDECPPEPSMYYCSFGEDNSCDCERCWTTYLIYVGTGRRGDPSAGMRVDE